MDDSRDRAARRLAAVDALRAHLAGTPTETVERAEEHAEEHARRNEEACEVLRAGLAARRAARGEVPS